MKTILITVAIALGAVSIGGCSEREQTVLYKNGKYRGKPDDRPWDSADGKGDRESWERQIRARGDTQNENRRIGH